MINNNHRKALGELSLNATQLMLVSKLGMPAGNLVLEILLQMVDALHVFLELLVHDDPALGLFRAAHLVDLLSLVAVSLIHALDLGFQVVKLVDLDLEMVKLLPQRVQLVGIKVGLLGELPET